MSISDLRAQRLGSVVAATLTALACGTNYAYSAWAPQFAERLRLSSTESNLIGTAGNLGMYAAGIPLGLLVDSKGPRVGSLIGALTLGLGYFLLNRAYVSGPRSMGVPVLFFFSFLTGLGSFAAFSASIKTAASNYPNHRGAATSFPLAAFGLSAFFFSSLSEVVFRDDTAQFLLVLAFGTSSLVVMSSYFLKILPHSGPYSSIPTQEPNGFPDSSPLRRTKSTENHHCDPTERGTRDTALNSTYPHDTSTESSMVDSGPSVPNPDTDETSSLISSTNSRDAVSVGDLTPDSTCHSHRVDLRGFAMITTVEFWQLFSLLGLLTGIGLMTINNIGNDAKALWKYYDDSANSEFVQKQQVMHVSSLSVFSFAGRLLSGIGSDLLVKKLHMSRFWCLFVSSIVFCIAQVAGSQISNPRQLIIVSVLTGLAYGILYGVYPSLVADAFGIAGFSQNWGCMCLAPVLSGNVFNLLYGIIYDRHSIVLPDGERDCTDGLQCYQSVYWITFCAGLAGAFVTLWTIWHERRAFGGRAGKQIHERIA